MQRRNRANVFGAKLTTPRNERCGFYFELPTSDRLIASPNETLKPIRADHGAHRAITAHALDVKQAKTASPIRKPMRSRIEMLLLAFDGHSSAGVKAKFVIKFIFKRVLTGLKT